MNIRETIFWIADALRGGQVRKHYLDIRQWYDASLDSGERDSQVQAKIDDLLEYAAMHTNFYRRYAGLPFKLWPVVDKDTIRQNLDDFLSSEFRRDTLHTSSTSGSTGTPFVAYWDREKKARNDADTLYFWRRIGYVVGNPLVYCRIWNAHNRKSLLAAYAKNIRMLDVSDVSDTGLKKMLDELGRVSGSVTVMCYGSIVELLASYCQRTGRSLSDSGIHVILSISEALSDEARLYFKNEQNVDIVRRYSDQECGILAQEFKNTNVYFINDASYHIEILNFDDDSPVSPGECGRIVLTDLYNRAMPFIRYDTGDVGAAGDVSGRTLTRIEGRKRDLIRNTQGEVVYPGVISILFWQYRDIIQYQFIQRGAKQYRIRINCGSDRYAREDAICRDVRHYMGEDAEIEFEYTTEIPVLASGKRKTIENLWNK